MDEPPCNAALDVLGETHAEGRTLMPGFSKKLRSSNATASQDCGRHLVERNKTPVAAKGAWVHALVEQLRCRCGRKCERSELVLLLLGIRPTSGNWLAYSL